jgi:hypothetical protein
MRGDAGLRDQRPAARADRLSRPDSSQPQGNRILIRLMDRLACT